MERAIVDGHAHAEATEHEIGLRSDSALARRVQAGDREAFGELARRYLRPLHAVVGSFLRDPADVEDVAQEAFLRALDRIHTFDPGRPFAPWLYQIARNAARNHRKRLARRKDDAAASASLADTGPGPDVRVARQEIRAIVDEAIEALPERQRMAFRLFDIEQYTAQEVASLLGIATGTVRSHVHHARRALRERLAPLLGEDTAL